MSGRPTAAALAQTAADLTAADLAAFARLRIGPELLAQAHIKRVTDQQARAEYGITGTASNDMSGIVFPYFNMTGQRVTCRVRRDNPEIEAGKEKNKYISAYGDRKHLYFPPGATAKLQDPNIPVALVEAEKSSLALTAWAERTGMNLLAVAMGGCWEWRGRIGKAQNSHGERVDEYGPVSDLSCVDGHRVYVLLDANAATSPKVQQARAALIRELTKRKCEVLVCDLPAFDGNGPDDYVGTRGDEAMMQVFADASARSEESLPAEYADDALALKFTDLYGNDLRYTAAWGRWSVWDGTCWKQDQTYYVFDQARKTCRAESSSCQNERLASRIASAVTVAAVERLARADRRHAATIDQWDRDLWLLNTPAGVVDLHTGALRPAAREDYMTKCTAVTPGGDCKLWISFLDRITDAQPELQQFMQRMCGYALTGVTREQALFFLYGTGANGKSVFINTIAGVMGDYARTAPIEAFIASTNEHHPTDLAGLQGARLVTAVETEDGRRWAESKLKALTGGDRIAARFMRQDFFEFLPQFKLVIAGNHKPGLRTVDEAMRRRFNLLPFTVTIPASERDTALVERLQSEWGGILQWAVEGCLAWQSEGLHAPATVKDATESYLAAEDVLARWLEDCCIMRPACWSSATALFQSWREWCDQNQEYAGSQKRFSENLESRGFAQQRTRAARGFAGIGLVTDVTDSPVIPVSRVRAGAGERSICGNPSHPSHDFQADYPSNASRSSERGN
jgi:putative DNA primase/helicase